MSSTSEITATLQKQRHALFIESAFTNLLQSWRSHFEQLPKEVGERKEILVALGTLGAGRTPRDAARVAALPALLLEASQLEALGHEIETIHAELCAVTSGAGQKG